MLEPILNPIEITIPPNDKILIRTNSLLYPENAVTGILQPSDLLHEEGDFTFCPALVTLNDGNILIPVNNFTDHPYKLKKGLHIANFSVMTPEQMKYVKPVVPASTWHLLQNDQEQAAHYVSSLIKKIIGSRLQKILEILRNTHLYKNESFENYRPYRTCITTPIGEVLNFSRIDKSWFSHLPKCVFKKSQKLCTSKKMVVPPK